MRATSSAATVEASFGSAPQPTVDQTSSTSTASVERLAPIGPLESASTRTSVALGEGTSLTERLIAIRATERELARAKLGSRAALEKEESELTTLLIAGTITGEQRRRRGHVEYLLSRLDDAQFGDELDQRDIAIQQIERIAAGLSNSLRSVARLARGPKRHRRR